MVIINFIICGGNICNAFVAILFIEYLEYINMYFISCRIRTKAIIFYFQSVRTKTVNQKNLEYQVFPW